LKHIRKIIAPVTITLVLLAYYVVFAVFIVRLDISLWTKLLAAIIPVLLAGVSIFVLTERINEIRSGEEDDLGKY
jgi:hypothetical protein